MAQLNFPPNAKCLVPGCRFTVTHQLSLRMRRKDTGADWAPNVPAYFCTNHATNGAIISLLYKPTLTGTNYVEVAVVKTVASRTTRIARRGGVKV